MSEPPKDPQIDLGIYAKPSGEKSLSRADLIALGISIVWLVGSGLFFLILGTGESDGGFDPMVFVMVIIAVFMPVAMIWVAAAATNSAEVMRREGARLQASIETMRKISVTQAQNSGTMIQPTVEKKLDDIARAQRKAEATLATFTTIRQAEARAPAGELPNAGQATEAQASLALGGPPAVVEQISVEDFITALNFPETAEDKHGFRALRRALQDPRAARVIQASQDVLTLISQDGIYMDDLSPDRARPELWRRFAQGERGRTIAGLGGVRDRTSLALTSARMRQDTIFRDAAHHFLRTFDTTFAEFEKSATDTDIIALADTRTARAFMLLGRVTGVFD